MTSQSNFTNNSFYRKLIPFIVLCAIMPSLLMAQYKEDYLKTANLYYAKGDYYSAAKYYEMHLAGKSNVKPSEYAPYAAQKQAKNAAPKDAATPVSSKEAITYRIAECYRMLNDNENTEKWYAQSIGFDHSKFPYILYWYGISLRANKKYEEAKNQFLKFSDEYKKDDSYSQSTQKELATLSFISTEMAKKDIGSYSVQKMGGDINPGAANYAGITNGNSLFFTSTRPDTTQKTSKLKSPYINSIYQAVKSGNGFSSIKKTTIVQAGGSEQGIASLSPDGKRIYFTNWHKDKAGKNMAAIFVSDAKNDTTWSEPALMDSTVNAAGYSAQQPSVTADGKYLFFSSNRPGGEGGFDIWYISLTGAAPAVNAGKTINTAYDEQAPFYHTYSQTLVFASNGRTGLGGFDIYSSKGNIASNAFAQPQNLGYPVNSVKDDMYFFSGSKSSIHLLDIAMVSSDRASACCLELFAVKKTYKKYITGKVIDCKTGSALAAVDVTMEDTIKHAGLYTQPTASNGTYFMEVGNYNGLKVSAQKAGYVNAAGSITLPINETDTLFNADICLNPVEIPKDSTVVIPQDSTSPSGTPMFVYFDFDKSNIRDDAYKVLDSLASILNKVQGLSIEIDAYTDGKGDEAYNLKLSRARAEACYDYLVNIKKIKADRFMIRANGKCCHVAEETTSDGQDNPDGRQLNRRVEFKIVAMK